MKINLIENQTILILLNPIHLLNIGIHCLSFGIAIISFLKLKDGLFKSEQRLLEMHNFSFLQCLRNVENELESREKVISYYVASFNTIH